MKKNRILNLISLILFLICIFELFYKFGEVPSGIHVDEAGSLYDAFSILNYSVDRFLYKNPVYFINYGGGQNALYTYLAIFFMKLFGKNLYSFRLVAVVFSLVSYFLFYKLIRKYDSKVKSIFILFLLTILPFYIMKSRWGLESYLLNSFFIISLYFFVTAIEKRSNLYYFISGICFGITLYTYAINYLILPLFLVSILIYLLISKKIKIKNIICLMMPIIIFAIPLILLLLINNVAIDKEIITNFISIPKLWNYRRGEISLSNFKFFIYDLWIIFFGDALDYNTIEGFGTMYFISIIFVCVGLYDLVKKVKENRLTLIDIIMLILFFVVLICTFLFLNVRVNKVNLIYVPLVYFIASFFEFLYHNKFKVLLSFILILYCCYYFSFINVYFNQFKPSYLFVAGDYFKVLDYVEAIYDNKDYSSICISTNVQQDYIFTLLTNHVSPFDFNNNVVIQDNKVFSYEHYIYDCDELNTDYVYLVSNDDKLIEEAKVNNYNITNIGDYYVLYKK